MKNKKIFFYVCTLLVVLFSINLYNHKTDKVQVKIEKSNKFTEDEINSAITIVKKNFKFQGCELTDIWYSEKKSEALTKAYLKNGGGYEKGIKEDNVIVLLSNFNVNSSGGDGSFEPNSTQSNWSWTLIRDNKKGRWSVVGSGYN
ncbi:hypothetical protein [Gottfriedia luciferensis]|uniref:hypothetical protein n=1 Tax=Gottfriedia luciferensis TaxID=178774 RepID=UPI001ABF61FA|nr:hypothetical protein [Gottfriedia luciferensis]